MSKWAIAMLLVTSCSLVVDTTGLTGGSGRVDAGTEAGSDVLPAETPDVDDAAVDAAPTLVAEEDAGADVDASEVVDASDVDASQDAGPSLPPDLVAAWTFEDATTSTALDVTGHGHQGVVSNGKHVPGKSGQALDFGFNGKMVVAGADEFDRAPGKAFSITAWTKLNSSPDHSFLFAIDYGTSAFGLEIRDSSHIDYYQGDSFMADGHVATSSVSFAGQWSHIAVVVAGANVKLYFNGIAVGSGTADASTRHATQITLGTSNYSDHLNAAVDNVRFYARALSDAEVVDDRDHP